MRIFVFNPAVCSKVGYQCRIDMRVTVFKKACVDLSVAEYAKNVSIDKYYKDKVKTVLTSAIYFKNFQKNSSNVKFVPSMLIARLFISAKKVLRPLLVS
ncbi:hypothetical protein BD770DRAFT_399644 [Pilaira anomala]|nr:hypothetical protein BD770DRAFT_399644 [Pilaira anomala]